MAAERPLHVGIDATTWWNNRGFGRFTRSLVTALLKRDRHRYSLVVDRPDQEILPDGVRVCSAASGRPITEAAVQSGARSLPDMVRLSRLVAKERFDVFFFPAVYAFFPVYGRTPCIVCFHDTIAERFPELTFPTQKNRWLWNAKTALAKRRATRAMTVSEASARDLEAVLGIDPSRIDVVTEGPDPWFTPTKDRSLTAAVRTKLGVPEAAQVLVYVGGVNPHKNLLSLLAAMPSVVERTPGAHLVIVGDLSKRGFFDNVDEVMARASAPRLQAHVTLAGRISDEEIVHLYGSSSALVLPSLWEGFGLPAVEAMACGVPAVASRRGSLPEVIGPAGLLFNPLDPRDIADQIVRLLTEPGLQQRLGDLALERAQRFTWDRGAELAEVSFERAVNEP